MDANEIVTRKDRRAEHTAERQEKRARRAAIAHKRSKSDRRELQSARRAYVNV